ncbi:MAG: UDP-glucose 4-epimerase GalE, partial [Bacteroidia bacterium]|nr:UDP-glucose 4-epimerase GalE [Bacteroidia bacterium]
MKKVKNILVTGGAGYIGSHTLICLLSQGHNLVVLDNLSNSSQESIFRVEQITNKRIEFQLGDVRDSKLLFLLFEKYKFDSVIHFAGLKSVMESHQNPLQYYDNNIAGTINLCRIMQKNKCHQLVFSSSATVYGSPKTLPINENFITSTTNPYGRSKLIVEDILRDLAISEKAWSIVLLRYFNPVGAHESGLIGEDPKGKPNNLLPYISQVAIGKLTHLNVFGRDYPTRDGTGVRDY